MKVILDNIPKNTKKLMEITNEIVGFNVFFDLKDTIWDKARLCEGLPEIDNIFLNIIYENLEYYIKEKYGEKIVINYSINGENSYFHVFEKNFSTLKKLKKIIKENRNE